MVTYGDYFSRKVLHYCGVSANKPLIDKQDSAYNSANRIEKIRSDMALIYQTLYSGHAQKNANQKTVDFNDLQVERKIVSAFYDSGVLTNAERDYFQTQPIREENEREKISVEEANFANETVKMQKIDAQTKAPVTRGVQQ